MQRYAIVRGHNITPEKVTAYLPPRYRVIWSGKTEWHCVHYGHRWEQFPHLIDDVVVIQGEDVHGWSLDRYVIPRLGSGNMRADECDLSHPIMKEIPVDA